MPTNIKILEIYVGVIAPLTILVPVVPAIVKYKYLSQQLKIATLYLLLSFTANIVDSILAFHSINNLPVSHVYTALEFTVLCLLYKKALYQTNISKYMYLIIIIFLLLCIANALFLENIFTFNSYTKSLESLIVVFFAIAYFKKNLDNVNLVADAESQIVFINAGLLLYFSGSLIFFVLENIDTPSIILWKTKWIIHASFVIVMYQLFALALWKYKK